jgi:methylenetetrahydrofolate dehydrogenase (NADP+)/methenyltetrahydrofolate cyclohydrolase
MVVLPETVNQSEAVTVIEELNATVEVAGVIILQPLPAQISRVDLADRLDPSKDIDGITTFNAGRLLHGDRDVLAPSTPAGGMALLKHYDVELSGKHAVVVGRSPVVGKPMALMLLSEDATVTVCHSRSQDLVSHTSSADILIAAAGRPGLISGDMIKPGATVVDFGVNFIDGKMVGDVEASSAGEVAGALTPVPGGTGRVTTAVLVRNTLKAAQLQQQKRNR